MLPRVMDWLVQGLRLGGKNGALGRALGPPGPRPALRVVAVSTSLVRPLRDGGHEVLGEEGLGGKPDAVCAVAGPRDLGPTLLSWAQAVRPGGRVVLVTRRGRIRRSLICASMLHAGLGEITQEGVGTALVTAGRVRRPCEVPASATQAGADGSHEDRQKTCDAPPAVRIGQSA